MRYGTRVQQLSAGLLFALAFFSAAAPLSIDLYLPGIPELQAELATSPAAAQATISGFMVGMAIGNLIFGPISDATGRKRPIIVAATVLLVASVLCAIAPSIHLLIAARAIQGLAGGCVVVVSRSVVPDLARGAQAARGFSALMALTGFMPAVAPALGGILLPLVGWRGLFWFIATINLIQVLLSLRLPESLPPEKRTSGALSNLFPRIGRCLRRPAYVGYMLAGALGFGALFAYIAASPLVLQRQLGFSPTAFAFTFGAISLLIPLSNVLNMRLVKHVPPRTLLRRALLIDALIAAIVLTLSVTGPTRIILPFLAGLVVMAGFVGANANALAVEEVRDIGAGAGSGAMGFLQFVVAAAVAPVAGVGSNHALAMAAASLTCAAFALAAVVALTTKPSTS